LFDKFAHLRAEVLLEAIYVLESDGEAFRFLDTLHGENSAGEHAFVS
jgi:hypothetical protein